MRSQQEARRKAEDGKATSNFDLTLETKLVMGTGAYGTNIVFAYASPNTIASIGIGYVLATVVSAPVCVSPLRSSKHTAPQAPRQSPPGPGKYDMWFQFPSESRCE